MKDQSSVQKAFLFSFYLFGNGDVVVLDLVCVNIDYILALYVHKQGANK